MPREELKKQQINCAKADYAKNYTAQLTGDVVFDLAESFEFYDKEESGYISI